MVNLSQLKVFDLSELKGKQRFIYFLFISGELFYIGITWSIRDRLKSHRLSKKKFDKVLYMEVNSERDCRNVENCLIYFMRPKGNKLDSIHKRFTRTWTERRMKNLIKKYFK